MRTTAVGGVVHGDVPLAHFGQIIQAFILLERHQKAHVHA